MTPALHPVDVIWAVDNSASQAPAIDQIESGLNSFATLLANQALDYRIVMLSLRSETSPISVNGSTRYAVCIPPPLAGDTHCANGPSFFQSSIDMRSTQMLEQVLGTFGQTAGYQPGDQRGGEAWAQALRPDASKSFVVVTDDNSRLSADQFETFAGGQNPFNSTTLPPGILNAAHAGMFEDYQFDGIYGWGSASNPATRCQYADTTLPTSAGEVYTSLVGRTGGVRAQICSSANWSPFFDAVATAVATAARIACELPLPAPASAATLLAGIELSGTQTTLLTEVATPEACGASDGFYRESETSVTLCPASCDTARSFVGPRRSGSLHARYECPEP